MVESTFLVGEIEMLPGQVRVVVLLVGLGVIAVASVAHGFQHFGHECIYFVLHFADSVLHFADFIFDGP
ncbi:hypothetical protein Nepgr_003050 [Nepenthes gracilis]|uniref:Uncharacterized protein n=1 Tax=Nepenthes gracilis TaxID=150966 RepID=A0AAD3RYT5_NEPGR|nr:hypothetical protein Nepgr_003050 [Nepenthes gracilis]